MKKYITYISFLLIVSCNSYKSDYLSEQYISLNNSIDVMNEKFEFGYNFFKGKTAKYKKFENYQKQLDSINLMSENILEIINEIRIDISGKEYLTATELENISGSYQIDPKVLGALKLSFMDYEDFFYSIIDKRYEILLNNISNRLNTDAWSEIEGINGENTNSKVLYVVLTKLYFDVLSVKIEAYQWFMSNFAIDDEFYFNTIEPIILSNKSSYEIGETIDAKIYLAAGDSTVNPTILVEDNEISVENGVGIYKKKVTKTGKFIKNGKVVISSPYSGDEIEYPFTIEYEVVK